MDFFSTNKGGEPPLTLSVSERRSKASPNTPRGGAKHGGTTIGISTIKGGFRINKERSDRRGFGETIPRALEGCRKATG